MTKTNKSSPGRSYGISIRSHTYMIVFMYCTERRKHYMYHNCAEPLISCSNEREWFELIIGDRPQCNDDECNQEHCVIVNHNWTREKQEQWWMGRCLFLSRLFVLYCLFTFFWSARARGDRLEEADDDGRWKTCNEFAPISQARSLVINAKLKSGN